MKSIQAEKYDWFFLVLTILAALLVRLDFLFALNFVIDADEAIVGLMAKHIVEGGAVPTFYYGQHYMGSLEPMLVAAAFSLFGISNIALKGVPLIFSLAFIVIVYELGKQLGGKWAGRVAALLAAFPPSALIIWSARARGGFIELVCIGAVATLITIKMIERGEPRAGRTALIGFVLGFGWWVNNQIIYFVLPIGFIMLCVVLGGGDSLRAKFRKALRLFISGVLAFLAGGLPFWVYNIQRDFVSFEMFTRAGGGDVFSQITGVFTHALPILSGARGFWQEFDRFPGSTFMAGALYLLVLAGVIIGYRGQLGGLASLLRGKRVGVPLLILLLFSCLAVFSLSSFGYLNRAPRYLLPLYVALFPLAGFGIVELLKRSRVLGGIAFSGLFVLHLSSCYLHGRALPGEPFVYKGERVSRDHSELVAWLIENEISRVRTNYWIGYRLAFETRERVRFSVFQKPYERRIDWYEGEARRERVDETPYVLVPSQAKIVRHALVALGYRYQTKNLSSYTVLYDIRPLHGSLHAVSSGIGVSASVNGGMAGDAVDGKRGTRWGSGRPQESGMSFEMRFSAPRAVRAFEYDLGLGKWAQDYPRELSIVALLASGEEVRVLSREDFRAVRYIAEHDPIWRVHLSLDEVIGLRLTQLGEHPVLDWSIAELRVFE